VRGPGATSPRGPQHVFPDGAGQQQQQIISVIFVRAVSCKTPFVPDNSQVVTNSL
jgi:hypothetical protein